jgi:6-pyruvoyltetrahydropterin/6-carboxytetrahydropterin synthase
VRVSLTRKVSFSSGHRFWLPVLSEAENRKLFGKWASPYNHGHNYVLDVTCIGVPEESTGMVVNIKTIDEVLKEHIVNRFDGKSINDEIEHFRTKPPTLENLIAYIREQLEPGEEQGANPKSTTQNPKSTVPNPQSTIRRSPIPNPKFPLPLGAELIILKLEESPTLWANLEKKSGWKMTLTRSYEFAASHRLYSSAFSERENEDLFGKCANVAGHGHNYILEVTVSGEPNPQTGMIADLEQLDEKVNALVVDRYDHKNLNVDLPEFEGKMTTSELVVLQIWDVLNGKLPAKLEKVRLQETARNIFEVSAG